MGYKNKMDIAIVFIIFMSIFVQVSGSGSPIKGARKHANQTK